jgi:hypothetical protein
MIGETDVSNKLEKTNEPGANGAELVVWETGIGVA